MFILHIDLPLLIGEPRSALLTDIFENPSLTTRELSRHHQPDFTATYLMQLQAARKRRYCKQSTICVAV